MKSLRYSTLLALSLVAALTLNASAQLNPNLEHRTNYSSGPSETNQFNVNNGYVASGSSLDSQPTNSPNTWLTTDTYPNPDPFGSTSLVLFTTNYTPLDTGDGNNSVLYGGYSVEQVVQYLPGIANVSLYYPFIQTGVFASPDLLRSVQFSIDFALIGPSATLSPTYTNQDYFGFNLLNGAGTSSLAQFRFNPFTGSSSEFLQLEWIQNGTNVTPDGITYADFEIEWGALYRLTATVTNAGYGSTFLNMSISGLQAQGTTNVVGGITNILNITNYAVVTNQNIINGGAISTGTSLAGFGRVSLDWELSSGINTDPGANYMIMTASSIISQAVPEPGTWAAGVLLLTGVGYAMARRRRAAANIASH